MKRHSEVWLRRRRALAWTGIAVTALAGFGWLSELWPHPDGMQLGLLTVLFMGGLTGVVAATVGFLNSTRRW